MDHTYDPEICCNINPCLDPSLSIPTASVASGTCKILGQLAQAKLTATVQILCDTGSFSNFVDKSFVRDNDFTFSREVVTTKIYDASSNVKPIIGEITSFVIIPCSNSRKLIFREVKFGILRSLSVKVLLGLEVLSFFNFVLGKDNLELGGYKIPRVLNRPSLEGRIIHLDLDKVLSVETPSRDMTVIVAKLPSAEKAVLPGGVYENKL